MTRIKLCGLTRAEDIECANRLRPEYIGFVFAKGSRRYLTFSEAAELKGCLDPSIAAVGVFVNEAPERIAELLSEGIIDIAQLHGDEDEQYIEKLRLLTPKPVIKAFRIKSAEDVTRAVGSTADFILLDSGAGTGEVFDWSLLDGIKRPYFLAGGLDPYNVKKAVKALRPYAVDVSSGIEKNGLKDEQKAAEFVDAVRKEETE